MITTSVAMSTYILYTLTHTDSTDQVPPSNQVRLEHFEMKTNDAYITTGVDIATTENEAYTTADNTISAQDVTYEQVLPEARDINENDYVINDEP